jgi:hypothetical protein
MAKVITDAILTASALVLLIILIMMITINRWPGQKPKPKKTKREETRTMEETNIIDMIKKGEYKDAMNYIRDEEEHDPIPIHTTLCALLALAAEISFLSQITARKRWNKAPPPGV